MALKLASHIHVGRLFYHPREPGKALENLSQALAPKGNEMVIESNEVVKATPNAKVSSLLSITYQRREIGKELLLLEKHFQQLRRLNGRECFWHWKHWVTTER